MIDAALRAGLAAFDDAALATLANPGLVRRAHRDVEDGKLRLVSAGAGTAAVEADGQLVTLDVRGPRAADCACKSVAICRHRIAAVLFLQGLEEIATVAEGAAPALSGSEDILAALDLTALERWSGKASWRAALELVATVRQVEPSANAISVVFADLDDPVRILRGQGFDGIVSKAVKARVKAYHAAAVLAAHHHFGVVLPEPVEDEALPAEVDIDIAFLHRVAASLGEVATLGFNLAPLPLEESLFELSVSSRADSLPRLSTMLRAIAAQLRLRRQRALAFDSDRMLELTATAFVLTRALASIEPQRRAGLTGKVRRDFAPAAPLTLVGCGGERWRTDTGARGVTAWFVEPETGRWLSTTLARGAGQDPAFAPAEAWRAQSMWQSEPLAVLAHARVVLEQSRLSADDRLSAPASARAVIVTRDVRPDPAWPGVVRDWKDLREAWLRQTGLGLDASDGAVACLVSPSTVGLPYFDDLAQQLVWPVRDTVGEWLALTLDHEEPVATAIEALEAHVRSGWEGMVLVRLVRAGEALEARPITLFGAGDPVDLSLWRRPYTYGRQQPGDAVRNWLERLRKSGARRFIRRPRGGTEAALAAAWRQLLDRAEIGPALAQSIDGRSTGGLAAHADRLDNHGLPALADLMRHVRDASTLLVAAYGLLVARQQRCGAPLLR
ncbi:hypothetical protein [Sphingomonas sp. ERG5]|uniref:hypothetical protein n=1 Tax=Sphingomonas sp. ERG5 TaxID=1381597 RepID=UPI000AE06FA0|nr:hypothetical protein [Sphingomonas sp. ERG5]